MKFYFFKSPLERKIIIVNFFQQKGTGKTNLLIRLSEKTGIPIAVSVSVNGVSIYKRAKEENRNIPKPILIESLWDLEHFEEVLIDDLDVMLKKLTNGRIKAITMTQDLAHDEEWFRMPKKEENEECRVSSYDVVGLKKMRRR